MTNSKPIKVLFAFILTLPLIVYAIEHYLFAIENGMVATWFYNYDMPYYLANAHQYLDGESWFIFYSNPFDFSDNSPGIYFQPITLLFSTFYLQDIIEPSLLLVLFGLLMTITAFYYLQLIIRDYCKTKGIINLYLTLLVAWGGGVFVLASYLVSNYLNVEQSLFIYDPFFGWWFLNFGRNFILPTEAFYHLLVLLLYFSILKNKLAISWSLTFLLAISHPFTGVQYAIIMLTWISYESLYLRSLQYKKIYILLFSIPFLFCITYYLLFLPSFLSHQILMEQWTHGWFINWKGIIGAYFLIFVIVILRVRKKILFKECFANNFNRFLLFSAVISFILANHEILPINTVQPLHFTRGHIWLPLCLLAIPFLLKIYHYMSANKNYSSMVFTIILFSCLMLSDNFFWFIHNYNNNSGLMITPSQHKILIYLKNREDNPVVISNDLLLGYVSPAYSSARPYYGHDYNTPNSAYRFNAIKSFFSNSIEPIDLINKNYLLIIKKDDDSNFSAKTYSYMEYDVYERYYK
ncbi:MAG: hypothetical protein ACKVHQ_00365 [Gammaproteobacteria bacterium]